MMAVGGTRCHLTRAGTHRVTTQIATAAVPVPARAFIVRCVQTALGTRRAACEVTVRIVGHAEARALNRRWRGHDYATNVLAFPAAAIPHISPPALGDIVLCAPVVVREALTQRKPPRAHWAHLLVHGVLHLLGDTHDRVASARRMQARERRILVRLGFSDPYREDVTV